MTARKSWGRASALKKSGLSKKAAERIAAPKRRKKRKR